MKLIVQSCRGNKTMQHCRQGVNVWSHVWDHGSIFIKAGEKVCSNVHAVLRCDCSVLCSPEGVSSCPVATRLPIYLYSDSPPPFFSQLHTWLNWIPRSLTSSGLYIAHITGLGWCVNVFCTGVHTYSYWVIQLFQFFYSWKICLSVSPASSSHPPPPFCVNAGHIEVLSLCQ